MVNDLQLQGVPLILFAIIYGFSQDGITEYRGGLQYLCNFSCTSKPTVIKALKELTNRNLIIRVEKNENNVLFVNYKHNPAIFNSGKDILPVVKNEVKFEGEGGKETLPNNKEIINNKELRNNIIYIVEYLNEKAKKSFKANNKTTQQHINARLSEGYTVDDFKTVIDKKCDEWLGTDFEQYLRPSTLFGSKFESYLNAPAKKTKQEAKPLVGDENYVDLDDVF